MNIFGNKKNKFRILIFFGIYRKENGFGGVLIKFVVLFFNKNILSKYINLLGLIKLLIMYNIICIFFW